MNLEYLELFVGGYFGTSNSVRFEVKNQIINVRYISYEGVRFFKFDGDTFGSDLKDKIKAKRPSLDSSNRFKNEIEKANIRS